MTIQANIVMAAVAMLVAVAGSHGQGVSRSYEQVEQLIGDRNVLSTSLRHLEVGLHRPTGFSQVFRAPGEPGKLMRVDGGLQAVFPQSVYVYNEDAEAIDAIIPANTVFRIGQRVDLHQAVPNYLLTPPGMSNGGSNNNDVGPSDDRAIQARVVPVGYGPAARSPMLDGQPLVGRRMAVNEPLSNGNAPERFGPPSQRVDGERVDGEEDELDELDVSGSTIIDDESYRRDRLHQLLRRASDAE